MPRLPRARLAAIRTLDEWPPTVNSQEMRRMEHWAAREFQGLPSLMVESAGRALTQFLWRRYDPDPDARILLLAGKGLNGAGILAAGRLMAHLGHDVTAVLAQASTKLRDEAKRELAAFRKEGGHAPARMPGTPLPSADFILDGLLGHGLLDGPSSEIAEIIRLSADASAVRIANDLPSGLHPDTGKAAEPTFRAAATVAMGFPKAALQGPDAEEYAGELYLADVGIPRGLYADFDLAPEDLFGRDGLVRLPSP